MFTVIYDCAEGRDYMVVHAADECLARAKFIRDWVSYGVPVPDVEIVSVLPLPSMVTVDDTIMCQHAAGVCEACTHAERCSL